MATVGKPRRSKMGNMYVNVVDVTMSSNYTTGGESLTPAMLGLTRVEFVIPSTAGGYMFEYDHPTNKLKVYTPTKAQSTHTHTENTAGAYTQNATTSGGGAITASAGAEVAGATNLATVTVRVMAVGM